MSAAVDSKSCTITIDASATVDEAKQLAADHGLSLDYVVDAFAGETLTDALARPALLPPLWPPHTLRAATLEVHAPSVAYSNVRAPRTASGPDLRALFFEQGPHAGAVERVTLRCEPAAEARWLAIPPDASDVARDVVSRFGTVVTLHGSKRAVVARVRRGSAIAALAERTLAAAGAFMVDPTWTRPRAVGVSVSWAHFERALSDGCYVACAGPTHVAVMHSCSRRRVPKAAMTWATSAAEGDPTARIVGIDVDWAPPSGALGEVVR